MSEAKQSQTILIVDDKPANLRALRTQLCSLGYSVNSVQSGPAALAALREEPVDLVLLDVLMPDLDGIETCRQLKSDSVLKEIPVIFLSVARESEDVLKGFRAGGVDYITKPFVLEEVQARVHTHLELRAQKLALAQANEELKASYAQLEELEELRDSLVHMIVHDMRSPLMGISGFLELAEMQDLPEKAADHVSRAMGSTQTLIEMVSSLLDVSKMESGQMELNLGEHDLGSLVDQAVQKLVSLGGGREITVEQPDQPVMQTCDGELILRVVQNLVGNALKFTSEADGTIRIVVEPCADTVRVSLQDNGPGIPEEYRDTIFEKFGQVAARENKAKYSTGLGLTFCKLAVEAHGGTIGFDSVVGEGSTFWFELPRHAGPRQLG